MKITLIAPLAALAVLAVPAYAATGASQGATKPVKQHVHKTNKKKKDEGAPAPAN